MAVTQPFKKYQRGQRIQTSDVSYANGMSYTNAPLEEGWLKLLVNFDLGANTNDLAISPRTGMSTTSDGLIQYPDGTDPLIFQGSTAVSDGMSIVAGNKVTRGGVEYKQIIVGRITGDAVAGRYTGDAWVLTVNGSSVRFSPLNDTIAQGTNKCYFTKPDLTKASIHGMPLRESEYIKSHIGTFAFNGDYYYFTTDGKLRHTTFNDVTMRYEEAVVSPFTPYISEAKNSLYNMLKKDPYVFDNQPYASTLVRPTSVQTYFRNRSNGNRELKLLPKSGEAYDYKLYYYYPAASNTNVCFSISYYNNVDGVEHFIARDETQEYQTGADAPDIFFDDIQINAEQAIIKIYCVPADTATFTEGKRLDNLSLAKATMGEAVLNYSPANQESSRNLEPITYALQYAKGMTYWKNRLWVYGARDNSTNIVDSSLLWASEPNRPDWFPYPANIDLFDEDIVYVQPMLDNLLVFTAHNLYSITLSMDGLSWTKQHLQGNLNITDWDLHLIQIVKNMVFFKSGNYYYMVVPKITSSSTGMAVAPISKTITDFLDSFESNVKQIVDDLYNYSLSTRYKGLAKTSIDLELVHYYNYLDYEDMHNTYVFSATRRTKVGFDLDSNTYIEEVSEPVLLNFSLLYNTLTRTWRTYTQESQRVMQPLFMNATGKGVYASLVEYDGKACVQFLEYSNAIFHDLYIKQGENTPTRASLFNNWQYFDTGSMEQNSDMKKRYREYQFKINNAANSALEFYTGFFIDKSERTYEMLYTQEEVDDHSDDVTTMVIDAVPTHFVQNEAIDTNYSTLGKWILSVSKFPNKKLWKIRIPTSGKGYLPRTVFISYNESDYEVLSHTTVYRELYSR